LASVNKQSLREELDAHKARFAQLVAEGKMPGEGRALVEALLMLLELLVAVFLEKHTPKTSANSSKPSSQTPNDDTALPPSRTGANGKGKKLDPAHAANTRTVETVQVSAVHFCEHCGEDLDHVHAHSHERRTRIDILFEKVVTHVDAEVKRCPQCRTQTRGAKELPPIPPRQNGKRGRIAKSDAHNLWERLRDYETGVLLFARDSHVPFTNNRAERDLRMSKVKQKVSGCFRKRQYAEAYCRISSYLQTMANRGYNPLVAIQMALSGELYAEKGE